MKGVRWLADLGIGAFLFGADRLAKGIALTSLSQGVMRPVGSLAGVRLAWTLTYNEGAAWGIFDAIPIVLLLFRCFFIGLLLFVYRSSSTSMLSKTAVAVILAGAVGNIMDSFVYGHVIDMIHVNLWGWNYPVFNLADAEICLGVAWLILARFFPEKRTG